MQFLNITLKKSRILSKYIVKHFFFFYFSFLKTGSSLNVEKYSRSYLYHFVSYYNY